MKYIKNTKDIAGLIKATRKSLGLTQVQLSGICDTGVRFIVDLEKGKETCEIRKVLNVIQALGLRLVIDHEE